MGNPYFSGTTLQMDLLRWESQIWQLFTGTTPEIACETACSKCKRVNRYGWYILDCGCLSPPLPTADATVIQTSPASSDLVVDFQWNTQNTVCIVVFVISRLCLWGEPHAIIRFQSNSCIQWQGHLERCQVEVHFALRPHLCCLGWCHHWSHVGTSRDSRAKVARIGTKEARLIVVTIISQQTLRFMDVLGEMLLQGITWWWDFHGRHGLGGKGGVKAGQQNGQWERSHGIHCYRIKVSWPTRNLCGFSMEPDIFSPVAWSQWLDDC